MSQSKYWCLTLNNYSEDDLEQWRKIGDSSQTVYLCFQKEIAPTTGTPHLQGYVVFPKVKRLTGVKKILGSAIHAVLSNGTPSQNRDYCTKSDSAVTGSFEEFGTLPDDPQSGKRTDFTAFKEAVSKGLRCKRQAREEFADLVAKYPRWCYDYIADQKDIQVPTHDFNEWQEHLNDLLTLPPNDREIIFVVDTEGGKGKTWFAKQYCKAHDDAQYLEPAKKVDMAYALQDSLRVLFVNITRTSEQKTLDYLYSFIESIKDGMVFSSKYESRMKYYGPVHVVCMMNMEPNLDMLSSDRYNIINLE